MENTTGFKHLLNRAGFGVPVDSVTKSEYAKTSSMEMTRKSRFVRPLNIIERPTAEEMPVTKDREKQKVMAIKSRKDILRLNTAWMMQLPQPEVCLRERMTLFWHDHFACRTRIPFLAQYQNNTLRENALGKFGDLLMAISKDPAMLQFLNNQQNKKGHPNENFARELLELFTLGHGNYTEDDIKNAARAFTGWSFDIQTGAFVFRERVHDDGLKTFLDKSGNLTGEDIIHQVLENKQTARFITQKIWNHFVSTELVDEGLITSLAHDFYQSDYDISSLVDNIFLADWFYSDKYVGNRIKSPVEYLAGIMVNTGGTFATPDAMIYLQKALGQVLFMPPNVGGWPNGKEWIDSSSLTFRMSLPAVLLQNSEINFQAKDDGDVNNETNKLAKQSKLAFHVDWEPVTQHFTKASAEETIATIENFLLPRITSEANHKLIHQYAGKSSSDTDFIRKAFIGFMSLPEYQLS